MSSSDPSPDEASPPSEHSSTGNPGPQTSTTSPPKDVELALAQIGMVRRRMVSMACPVEGCEHQISLECFKRGRFAWCVRHRSVKGGPDMERKWHCESGRRGCNIVQMEPCAESESDEKEEEAGSGGEVNVGSGS